MPTYRERPRQSRVAVATLTAILLACVAAFTASAAPAAPSEDRILPVEQYTSEKGRMLARNYGRALRDLNATIYHCMPWVEVQRQSIGFYKPKGATQDDRYLSVRLYIEQEPSAQFSGMAVEERASSMFSRYVGPMLRRMISQGPFLTDESVDGFTVILEWLKQVPENGARPVHETIAVFVEKAVAAEFVAGTLNSGDLASRARVLAWDGETPLGALRVAAWDDNFVATYKVQNYQLAQGVSCP